MMRAWPIIRWEYSIQMPAGPQHSVTLQQHATEIVDVLEYIITKYHVEALVLERKLLADANRKTDSLVVAESFD